MDIDVGIVMGSDSDLPVMGDAADILDRFEVPHEIRVVSAHRRPFDMLEYGRSAAERGLKVIIAGAGGAAHLPGMLAAATTLPVVGVPVPLSRLDGMDSLLSIVQMPRGVPVATVAIGNATNAGLLAVRMLALADGRLAKALADYATEIAATSAEADDRVNTKKSDFGFR
jgi:5-(carboxyamino)imidazole ribonucleotide mutase